MSHWQFVVAGVTRQLQIGWTVNLTQNGRNRFTGRVISLDGSYRPALDDQVILYEQVDIQSISVANPTTITTKEEHGLVSGRLVGISNVVGNTPVINGYSRCTVLTPTTFTIPFNVTIAGSGGYTQRNVFYGNSVLPRETGLGDVGWGRIVTSITAVSFDAMADRRFVNTVLAAGTLKSMVTTLVANYMPGIALDPNQPTGPTLAAVPCVYSKLSDVLNLLGNLAGGYVWEYDAYGFFRMYQPSGEVCPFTIATGDKHVEGDVGVEYARTNYANRIILRFTSAAISAYAFLGMGTNVADGDTVTIGSRTYLFQTTLTDADGHVHIGAANSDSISNLINAINLGPGAGSAFAASMTANTQVSAINLNPTAMKAFAQAVGAVGNSIGVASSSSHASWFTEGGGATSTFGFGADAALTSVVIAENTSEQATHGIWEALIDAPDITTLALANSTAAAILAVNLPVPRKVNYATRKRGLLPGQKQNINLTTRNLNNDFMLTDVTGVNDVGNSVKWTVAAIETFTFGAVPRWQDTYKQWSSGGGGSAPVIAGGGGGGGDGTTGSGTPGKLPKWTAPTTLGDSIVSESSGALTVTGTLAVTSTLGWGGGAAISTSDIVVRTSGTVAPPQVLVAGSANTAIGNANLTFSSNTLTVGNVITTPAATDLIIQPTGNIITNPVTKKLLPVNTFDVDIGSLLLKYASFYAAELHVETLVAQQTITTIGGRAIIASGADILSAALASGATTMSVKYNNLTNGDIIIFEGPDQAGAYSVEFMAVASAASGGGPYTYTITRNLDGTGANNWPAGATCMNTGQTGAGFIDMYAIASMKPGSFQFGPTIVGNIRNSSTYNDWSPRWAVGNLNGIYNIGSNTYGFAAGNPSADNITLEPINGLRFLSGSTVRASLTSGTFTFGTAAHGISWDGTSLQVTGAFTINTVTGFGTTEFDLGIHLKQVATQFIYPGSQTGSGFQALSYLASSGSTGSSGLYTNNGFTINAVGLTVSAGGAAITGAVSMSSTVSTPALGSNTGTTLVLDASNFVKANSSSERFKSNVRRGWDHRNGQSSLLSVSPILFDYDDGVSNVLGFSAEEVHAAGLTDLVNLDAEGKPFSLREHGFLAHLTSIARDHEARLTALERK